MLKILTVCSHNRTRSVMSMAMIQAGLDERLGPGQAAVRSLGFGPEGMEAIPDAVAAMARRGLDVSSHRSRKVTAERIAPADLVLTAQKDHVIEIAGVSPAVYRRTFTMPEFLERAMGDPVAGSRSLGQWAESLSADRVAADYLRDDVAEIWDPTGSSPRVFAEAVEEIAAMCDTVVTLLARTA